MKKNRIIAWLVTLLVVAASVAAILSLLDRYCPASGLALTSERGEVHRLKNRKSFPEPTDFDLSVTLAALLQPGNDENRWQQTRAARVEGYVVSVGRAGVELANCYSPSRRDIHINLALRTDSPPAEQVVVEVTPYFERLMESNGVDWSAETLRHELVGRWCRVEGWLFFDTNHAKESRNLFAEGEDLWRATAWELHPVTKIEVIR